MSRSDRRGQPNGAGANRGVVGSVDNGVRPFGQARYLPMKLVIAFGARRLWVWR